VLPSEVAAALSNSAATYELGGAAGHHGCDNMPYCHASSPIRRYADLYNQRLIKQFIKSESDLIEVRGQKQLVYRLNEVSKSARNYDRISCFLKNIESMETVDAFVISDSKIYVVPWKMSFRMSNEYPIGTTIRVKYYYDASKIDWPSRLVFTAA
jgi:exoribonuclease R